MSISQDLHVDVLTTPQKILARDPNRWSWTIFNPAAHTVYYMRGRRGQNVSTSGNNQGVPIARNVSDGYDDQDAVDEVWIVGGTAVSILLGITTKKR